MASPDWFRNRIITGLQRIYTLSLPGTPASDVIAKTAETWVDVLWPMKAWDEQLDLRRMSEAFRILASECDRWPAPRQLIDKMPPRPELQRLTDQRPANPPPEHLRRRLRAIVNGLADRLTTDPRDR